MTPIPEIIFSGFVSKAVNDIVDVSKDKIRKAVINKNAKHQNIESQIYNVIVDVLNKNTYNQYENNQDKIYDAADALFRSFKENKGDNVRNIQSCLRILSLKADENGCLEFKVSLYEELGRDEYDELFHAILLLLLDQKSQYDNAVYEQLNQKLDEVNLKINKLDQKLDDIHKKQDDTIIQEKDVEFQNNKKQKYIESWNSRLFLHMDDDKNPITLAGAFIVPRFEYYFKMVSIKFSDRDSLTEVIEKFIRYDKTSNLLITGSPGIGKTSIISWIADKYKNDEDIIILRFRDWSNKDLVKGLFNAICISLGCESADLENKVLIIDGFDEVKSVNERKSLIQEFFNNTLDFDNLKVIITSRPDYLDTYDFQNAIKVLPFDISQIKEFYQIIKGGVLDQRKIDVENLDVLGIPVILYMAIMTEIDLTLKTTKPELYNKIFAEKGGIFDRFCFRGIGYDGGFQPLRDENNVKKYLNFLQQVAFSMFEKNDLVLTEKEYDTPELMFQGETLKIVEFPIKPFFESDGYNIEFIHKSIYEYFVSELIFDSISEKIRKSDKEIAGVFGCLLKRGILSNEILEYLKYKIRGRLDDKFDKINSSFRLMMQDGMTYYTNKRYQNVITCEMNVFANMLQILHLWKDYGLKLDDLVAEYLRYNRNNHLNLRGVMLKSGKQDNDGVLNLTKGLNLKDVYLERADLRGVYLYGANLKNAYLRKADLRDSNLKEVDLRGADLRGAQLQFACLESANLLKATLVGANLIQADLRNVDLTDINLLDVDLEASRWYKDDVLKAFPQLEDANFTYIIVEDQQNRKCYRSDLFPDEK